MHGIGMILPLLAIIYCAFVLWMKKSLPALGDFPLDVILFWIFPFFVALCNEIILARLPPLPSMTFQASMFQSRDSLIVLIVLLVAVFLLVGYFVVIHYRAGKLVQKGKYYVAFALAYVLFPYIGFVCHLHHYIMGLLLLFATSIQTRTSMICQGFAIGLFLQGVIKVCTPSF